MLKSKVNRLYFYHFYYFNGFMLGFPSSLKQIYTKTHNLSDKAIVKHLLTVVEYIQTTINKKFSTVNHYLTNCRTKNIL